MVDRVAHRRGVWSHRSGVGRLDGVGHPPPSGQPASCYDSRVGVERRWTVGLLSAIAVVFGSLTIAVLRNKHFTIDEFQYAHSAWLVAHGHVPYRDFFNDRFP